MRGIVASGTEARFTFLGTFRNNKLLKLHPVFCSDHLLVSYQMPDVLLFCHASCTIAHTSSMLQIAFGALNASSTDNNQQEIREQESSS